MISALFYLHTRSVKNRLLSRFKRLKQPKYLLGAVAGGLYFYFYFYRFIFRGGGTGGRMPKGVIPAVDLPDLITGLEWFGALVLAGFVVLAWLLPKERVSLDFTEAEIAFLFPAPVSRKTLIHFKLIRSQLRILISAFFFTLISGRFTGGGHAWIHAVGWWVILSTLNLHYLGCSFAQSLLFDRGVSTWKRRWVVLSLVAVVAVAVYGWGHATMHAPTSEDVKGVKEIGRYLQGQLAAGPMFFLLYPFRLVVRPFLAPDALALGLTLGPALLLLALHYWWVMRMDVSFEEASLAAAQKRATVVAAIRAGNPQLLRPAKKRKLAPFKLNPLGPRMIALFWKNLIVVNQAFSFRFWAGGGTLLLAATLILGRKGGAWAVLPMLAGTMSFMGLFWTLFFGPQVMRQDLRQDLVVADVLKQYPLSGWQIVFGEVSAPVAVLTAIQWVFLGLCFIFAQHLPYRLNLPLGERLAWLLGAGMVVPTLTLLWLLIPNAAVLFFPGWFRTAGEPQQGMEMTGQRLIMMFGQVLMLVVSLLPAGGIFALIFFLAKALIGLEVAVLLGALFTTVALAAEAAGVIYLLGRMFERLDLSAEN